MIRNGTPYDASHKHSDWLRAWKEWARGRKRGKMAQFIVDKLEEGKQACWIDIALGKFELSEWHAIAEEWYRAKPNRNSDETDAPCMLRKGLPRAFPGLEEVKLESMKEGTQYRSRTFQANRELIQEVTHHLPNIHNQKLVQYSPSSGQYKDVHDDVFSSPGHLTAYPVNVTSCVPSQTPSFSDDFSDSGSWYNHSSIPFDLDSETYGFPNMSMSPATGLDKQLSPYSSSPYTTSQNSPQTGRKNLVVPQSETGEWSSPGSSVYGSPLGGSPSHKYSSDVVLQSMSGSSLLMPPIVGPSITTSAQVPIVQESLQIQAIPSKSPLEGGGQLAMLLNHELPPGKKMLIFASTTKPEFTTYVECTEANRMALMTTIPKHAIPEPVQLQLMCNGELIATTEFLYYADAAYNSEIFYQFLCQNLPQYFYLLDNGLGGAVNGDGTGDGGVVYGAGFGGTVPSSMYGILLGSCRMGLEALAYATLMLPAMKAISAVQLEMAHQTSLQCGHQSLANLLFSLLEAKRMVARGANDDEKYVSALSSLLRTERTPKDEATFVLKTLADAVKDAKKSCEKDQEVPGGNTLPLQVPGDSKEIEKSQKTSSLEEDKDIVHKEPVVPPDFCPVKEEADSSGSYDNKDGKAETNTVNVLTKYGSVYSKLHRQDKYVGDGDDAVPLEELADRVPPLKMGKAKMTGGHCKVLVSATSDADSAVSMSFDEDNTSDGYTQSSLPPASALLAESGKEATLVSILLEPCTNHSSLPHYEQSYLLMEDYVVGQKKLNRGDRIVSVGGRQVSGLTPVELSELLQKEAQVGTTIKFLPPNATSTASVRPVELSTGRQLKQPDGDLCNAVISKLSTLLTIKSTGARRQVTIPRGPEGFRFKVLGGNAVGLFVTESFRHELSPGDQILEINGNSTRGMKHYEATTLIRQATEQLTVTVADNHSRYVAVKDQLELESFYLRSCISHNPEDPREMKLTPGSIVRVVNTILYADFYWLAWSVDNLGLDVDLRKIPSPFKLKGFHRKYDHIERHTPSHFRPLVLLGTQEKLLIKELDGTKDFTECTKPRDVERLCLPGCSQHAVVSVTQPSDLDPIKKFHPIIIHAVMSLQSQQQDAVIKKTWKDFITATVEADTIQALVAAVTDKVKLCQQQPIWQMTQTK